MSEEDIRRRAAELLYAESRYRLPSWLRFFLLGVAFGLSLCELLTLALE